MYATKIFIIDDVSVFVQQVDSFEDYFPSMALYSFMISDESCLAFFTFLIEKLFEVILINM